MKREILISATQREVRVAILEDDQLVEMAVERPEARRMIGDIYWGKVESVLPGLQAAFVDIGTEKSAFLHASDLVYDEGDDDDDDDDDDADLSDPDPEQPESAEAAASQSKDSLVLPNEGASAREGRGRRRGGRGRGRRGGKPGDPNAAAPGGTADGAADQDESADGSDGEMVDIASLAPDDDSPYAPVTSDSTALVPVVGTPLAPDVAVPAEGSRHDAARNEPPRGDRPRNENRPPREPRPPREAREPREGREARDPREERAPKDGQGKGEPSERSEKPERQEKAGGRSGGGRRKRKEPPQIQDVLKRGQSIIVQVSKEPISTKGPRVTAQVSLAGRFVVFMPFASRVGVSRKIGERAERQRLREQVQKVLPKNSGGVIVRTVGEDVTQETFEREITTLISQWTRINKKTKFVGSPPKLLHRETSLTRGIIRDLFSTKVDKLTVDSKQVYNEIIEYLSAIAPELVDRVVLYEEKVPLFDKADIETEIRDLFKRRCDLPSGGYLIIEPTEALVSVDVNSGRFVGKKDPEKTILKTNTEAAREVARQLRLRDIGGIIVCDFIDMESRQNREKVLHELRTHLGRDRARTKAFAVSELGLIEMTRQRVRQSHLQSMTESCPVCGGTGRVFTPETIIRRMERSVRRIAVEGRRDSLVIKLHPDTAMYLLEHEKDLLKKLEKGLGFTLEMRDDPLLRPDEFKLVVKGAGRDVTQQYAVA